LIGDNFKNKGSLCVTILSILDQLTNSRYMKILFKIIPLLLITLLVSCSANPADSETNSEDAGGDGKAEASLFDDVVELASKSELTNVEFNRVVNFMEGQEVTLTGYPYAYPLGIGTEVEFKPNSTDLIDGTDNSLKTCSISVDFEDETETKVMHIGDLFAVKGKLKISHSSTGTRITLQDAVYVDSAKEKGGTLKSVGAIDPSKEIFCGDLYTLLHAHYTNLAKNKLTITGEYISQTISKSTEGEILEIRLDIGTSDNKVGCEMIEEPNGNLLASKRNNGTPLKIQGTFSRIVFGSPRISESILK
jgi:hypothetical protein